MSLFTVQKHVSHGLRRRNVMVREEVYEAEGWLRVHGEVACEDATHDAGQAVRAARAGV
jgi:hypothetical protein